MVPPGTHSTGIKLLYTPVLKVNYYHPEQYYPPTQLEYTMHKWNLSLNISNTIAIRATVKIHDHPDYGELSSQKLIFCACIRGKLFIAPHQRTHHNRAIG